MNFIKKLNFLPPGMKSRGALVFCIGYKSILLAKRNAVNIYQAGMMVVDTDDGLISLCSEVNTDLFSKYGTLILGHYNDGSCKAVFTNATEGDNQRIRRIFVFFQGESGNFMLFIDNDLLKSGCYELDYGPIYDEDAFLCNQKRSRLIISLLDREKRGLEKILFELQKVKSPEQFLIEDNRYEEKQETISL